MNEGEGGEQEGGTDSRRSQPESAGCSARQARCWARLGWAGRRLTQPGLCRHCSPCPSAGHHPTHSQANQRRGPPQRSREGFRASPQGPVSTLRPWPWTLDLNPDLPTLSPATTRCLRSSLSVSPPLPTPSPGPRFRPAPGGRQLRPDLTPETRPSCPALGLHLCGQEPPPPWQPQPQQPGQQLPRRPGRRPPGRGARSAEPTQTAAGTACVSLATGSASRDSVSFTVPPAAGAGRPAAQPAAASTAPTESPRCCCF